MAEDRRTFVRRLLPRLAGLWVVFSYASPTRDLPAWAQASGGQSTSVLLESEKYRALLKTLSNDYQLNPESLRATFSQAVLLPKIIEIFDKPPEKLSHYEYKERFINDALVEKGRAYLAANIALLRAIETEYGVEKEIICAILGVETKFGQEGIEKYRVFDVLNTGFSLYPRREAFYRDELIQYLLLCREEAIDPLSVKGSYGGAMGMPQFMPSSFRKHAVDYDKDGKRNIWTSPGDILGSVANYLKKTGWQYKRITHTPALMTKDTQTARTFISGGVRETHTLSEIKKHDIAVLVETDADETISFASYQPVEDTEVLLALFENFRVLLGYNFSVNYVLVVTHLARRLL